MLLNSSLHRFKKIMFFRDDLDVWMKGWRRIEAVRRLCVPSCVTIATVSMAQASTVWSLMGVVRKPQQGIG